MQTIDKITLTASNIDDIREQIGWTDMRSEIKIGDEIEYLTSNYLGYNVATLIIHSSMRAAQCTGGDSIWGDWYESSRTLRTDDGQVYDLDGEELTAVDEESADHA